jgi:hypothetical protein
VGSAACSLACVGENGGPYGFDAYALGYFEAARRVWESIKASEVPIDVTVYPLAYLYRQGIELSIKHLCYYLSAAYSSGNTPELTHGLSENWHRLRRLLEEHAEQNNYGELQSDQLDAIGRLLSDFEKMDADSFVFRYPASKKGDLYLQNQSRIDLVQMNRILEAASHWFEDVMEGVREDLIA